MKLIKSDGGEISDVTREYALFEFLEEGNPLLDVADSDKGKLEESHAQSDENRVIDHVAYEVSTRRSFDHRSGVSASKWTLLIFHRQNLTNII